MHVQMCDPVCAQEFACVSQWCVQAICLQIDIMISKVVSDKYI